MKLINEWYYFKNVINDSDCERLMELGKNNFMNAEVGKDTALTKEERIKGRNEIVEKEVDYKRRKSQVVWANEDWIYNLLNPYMVEANNKSGWNFDIKACETPQLTKYKKDDFFSWHIDGHSDSLSTYDLPENKFLNKNVRKISMTLLLNEDYEGGNFQFGFFNKGDVSIANPEFSTKGSLIFFPSFIYHQVTPITQGTRYSLVAWFIGPPFK